MYHKALPKELYDLYSSSNIIWVMKSRRMGLARHEACMGRGDFHTRFWWGNLRERDHLEYLVIGVKIILKWIFKQ
jgi:hypothetical protein